MQLRNWGRGLGAAPIPVLIGAVPNPLGELSGNPMRGILALSEPSEKHAELFARLRQSDIVIFNFKAEKWTDEAF
jgi:hypothetical protein